MRLYDCQANIRLRGGRMKYVVYKRKGSEVMFVASFRTEKYAKSELNYLRACGVCAWISKVEVIK